MYLLLLRQMHDINSMSNLNALAQNRLSSVPCTVRTFRQGLCNKRVGYLQWLISRAFGPAKRPGPRLFSTVPWGINHTNLSKKLQWGREYLPSKTGPNLLILHLDISNSFPSSYCSNHIKNPYTKIFGTIPCFAFGAQIPPYFGFFLS